MTSRTRLLLLGILLAVTASSGCLWAPDLSRMRRDIESQVPGAHFKGRVKLSLGPESIHLARWITALIPPAGEVNAYLHDLQRLEIATFDTKSLPSLAGLEAPGPLRQLLDRGDWKVIVKVHQDRQALWVLAHDDADVVRELYMVSVDPEHLVLAHLEGDMEQLLATVLQNHSPEEFGLLGSGHSHDPSGCTGVGVD
jgi:hypothetical protein